MNNKKSQQIRKAERKKTAKHINDAAKREEKYRLSSNQSMQLRSNHNQYNQTSNNCVLFLKAQIIRELTKVKNTHTQTHTHTIWQSNRSNGSLMSERLVVTREEKKTHCRKNCATKSMGKSFRNEP